MHRLMTFSIKVMHYDGVGNTGVLMQKKNGSHQELAHPLRLSTVSLAAR